MLNNPPLLYFQLVKLMEVVGLSYPSTFLSILSYLPPSLPPSLPSIPPSIPSIPPSLHPSLPSIHRFIRMYLDLFFPLDLPLFLHFIFPSLHLSSLLPFSSVPYLSPSLSSSLPLMFLLIRKSFQPDQLDVYWENLVLALIGETIDDGDDVCGCRVVDKSNKKGNLLTHLDISLFLCNTILFSERRVPLLYDSSAGPDNIN